MALSHGYHNALSATYDPDNGNLLITATFEHGYFVAYITKFDNCATKNLDKLRFARSVCANISDTKYNLSYEDKILCTLIVNGINIDFDLFRHCEVKRNTETKTGTFEEEIGVKSEALEDTGTKAIKNPNQNGGNKMLAIFRRASNALGLQKYFDGMCKFVGR